MVVKKKKDKTKKEGAYLITMATIENNYPICPICGQILSGGIIDYKEVIHEGERYVEFLKFCNTSTCRVKAKYYAQISLEGIKRFSFEDVEEIKEEEIVIKEELGV